MKKLRVVIVAIIMLVLMLIPLKVNAASLSCSLGITPNITEIKGGDTVTFNFVINNLVLSDGAPGITILDGKLEYDSSIFEEVQKSDINCGNNRSVTYSAGDKRVYVEYDNENGLVTSSGTVIFSITMKVRADAQFESTQVKFTNAIVTDNNEEVYISGASPVLKSAAVTPTPTPTPTPNETPAPTPTPDEAPTPTPSTKPSTTTLTPGSTASTKPIVTPKTTPTPNTDKKLPQTGVKETGILIVATVAVVGCGLSLYKYIKYKDMTK